MKFSVSVFLLVFVIYILFSGSISLYDLITGLMVSIISSILTGKYLVKNEAKTLNPRRWLMAIIFFLKYMTIIEAKAHWDVVKILFKGNYKPGIVRIPIGVRTNYAKLLVSSSITNTPGTVVVDISDKYLYVNWINVVTEEPEEARKHISLEFEKYAEKIFD
ncbi:MAG: Na+/H+ antiporter subunit E [Desulfurococcaceae archaeon]|uniref:Cation:proton antiporter n=1 Tax=Staphylothermus marinus TaxID=2280 RepID=A0A7C4D7F9_STAMA